MRRTFSRPWLAVNFALLGITAWGGFELLSERNSGAFGSIEEQFEDAAFGAKVIGPWTVNIAPARLVYRGEGNDSFAVKFCSGCWPNIRRAWLSAGPLAAPYSDRQRIEGTVYRLSGPKPAGMCESGQLWLSVESWSGEIHHANWEQVDRECPQARVFGPGF